MQKRSGIQADNRSAASDRARSYDGGDLFLVDRQGDPANVRYGTNSRSAIPAYRPPNERKTIGNASALVGRFSSGISLLTSLSRDERLALKKDATHIVKYNGTADNATTENDSDRDYLALSTGKRRRIKKANIVGLSASDVVSSHGSTSESETDGDADKTPYTSDAADTTVKHEYAGLSARVKSEPHNAQAWLDFIAYQETWQDTMQITGDQGQTSAGKRGVSELRLSIWQSALTKMGKDHPKRSVFQLGMLDEGSKIWDSTRLTSKWEEVVQQNPNNRDIQMGYINFAQTRPKFTFEQCRVLYCKYLALLQDHVRLPTCDDIQHQLYAVLQSH